MKKFIAFVLTAICSTLFVFVSGCNAGKPDSLSLNYFNTLIYVQTIDKPISEQTKTKLNDLFSSLQSEFDVNDSNSLICKFNNAPSQSTFILSKYGKEVFEATFSAYEFTEGYFNPTVYPLVELWQFVPNYPVNNFAPPTSAEILTSLSFIDFESVLFDKQNSSITKTKDGVKLDFGGVLKGFAVEKAYEILLEDGHDKGYISIGSSSIKILQSQQLGVRHPRATTDMPVILSINTQNKLNLSVSSSGDYEKVYEYQGDRFSHLINPFTGSPSNTSVQSVNILGVDGALADALTTAGCLIEHNALDIENSQLIKFFDKIIIEHPSAMIFAVYDDGENKQILTNEQISTFTLHDNSYTVVNF